MLRMCFVLRPRNDGYDKQIALGLLRSPRKARNDGSVVFSARFQVNYSFAHFYFCLRAFFKTVFPNHSNYELKIPL